MSRLVIAAILAFGLATVPTVTAQACSCAFSGYAEAIADADAAFVGTVIQVDEPPPDRGNGMEQVRYQFTIERSRDPMPAWVAVHSHFGGEANCGIDLDVGQRWLIVAHGGAGRLETNGCTGTARLDAIDARDRGEVVLLLGAVPESAAGANDPVPLEIVLLGGAALLIVLASALAFRRRPT
jgi:hypothetical protein